MSKFKWINFSFIVRKRIKKKGISRENLRRWENRNKFYEAKIDEKTKQILEFISEIESANLPSWEPILLRKDFGVFTASKCRLFVHPKSNGHKINSQRDCCDGMGTNKREQNIKRKKKLWKRNKKKGISFWMRCIKRENKCIWQQTSHIWSIFFILLSIYLSANTHTHILWTI